MRRDLNTPRICSRPFRLGLPSAPASTLPLQQQEPHALLLCGRLRGAGTRGERQTPPRTPTHSPGRSSDCLFPTPLELRGWRSVLGRKWSPFVQVRRGCPFGVGTRYNGELPVSGGQHTSHLASIYRGRLQARVLEAPIRFTQLISLLSDHFSAFAKTSATLSHRQIQRAAIGRW